MRQPPASRIPSLVHARNSITCLRLWYSPGVSRRSLLVALSCLGALSACGEDSATPFISVAFSLDGPGGNVAPVGFGPENRIVVGSRQPPGTVATFDARTGAAVDAPFDAFATEAAPIALDRTLVFLTPVGRLAYHGLDGASLGLFPMAALGRAVGPVVGPGSTLRVATTDGRLVALDADGTVVFETAISGAAVGLEVLSDGTSYVTTDLGQLYVIANDGGVRSETTLSPPVSAPGVLPSGEVAVVSSRGLEIFSAAGAAGPPPNAAAAGAVVAGDEVFVAWTNDGRLVGVDASGTTTFETRTEALAAPPVPLPGGRFGVVDGSGTARTLGPDGAVLAESTLDRAPTGPITVDARGRGYIPAGASVLAVDLALDL